MQTKLYFILLSLFFWIGTTQAEDCEKAKQLLVESTKAKNLYGRTSKVQEALKLCPDADIPHYELGLCLEEKQDESGSGIYGYKTAKKEYLKVLQINPNHIGAYLHLGGIEYVLGNLDSATYYYHLFWQKDTIHNDTILRSVQTMLGKCAWLSVFPKGSIKLSTLQKDPDRHTAALNFGIRTAATVGQVALNVGSAFGSWVGVGSAGAVILLAGVKEAGKVHYSDLDKYIKEKNNAKIYTESKEKLLVVVQKYGLSSSDIPNLLQMHFESGLYTHIADSLLMPFAAQYAHNFETIPAIAEIADKGAYLKALLWVANDAKKHHRYGFAQRYYLNVQQNAKNGLAQNPTGKVLEYYNGCLFYSQIGVLSTKMGLHEISGLAALKELIALNKTVLSLFPDEENIKITIVEVANETFHLYEPERATDIDFEYYPLFKELAAAYPIVSPLNKAVIAIRTRWATVLFWNEEHKKAIQEFEALKKADYQLTTQNPNIIGCIKIYIALNQLDSAELYAQNPQVVYSSSYPKIHYRLAEKYTQMKNNYMASTKWRIYDTCTINTIYPLHHELNLAKLALYALNDESVVTQYPLENLMQTWYNLADTDIKGFEQNAENLINILSYIKSPKAKSIALQIGEIAANHQRCDKRIAELCTKVQ